MSAAAVAACLLAPATASAASSRVAALQVALRAHDVYTGAVDGIAGPATTAGVRRIQARAGLAVDGIVGPRTRRALGAPGPPSRRQPPAAPGPPRLGRRRAAVRARDPRLPVRAGRRRLRRPHGGGGPARAGVRRPAGRRRRRPGDARRALPPARPRPGAAAADPGAGRRPLRPARRRLPRRPRLPRAQRHPRHRRRVRPRRVRRLGRRLGPDRHARPRQRPAHPLRAPVARHSHAGHLGRRRHDDRPRRRDRLRHRPAPALRGHDPRCERRPGPGVRALTPSGSKYRHKWHVKSPLAASRRQERGAARDSRACR